MTRDQVGELIRDGGGADARRITREMDDQVVQSRRRGRLRVHINIAGPSRELLDDRAVEELMKRAMSRRPMMMLPPMIMLPTFLS